MEKPWLNSYPEGVPETISTPDYLSITQMIDACLIKYADRKAYSNMGSSFTFKELTNFLCNSHVTYKKL